MRASLFRLSPLLLLAAALVALAVFLGPGVQPAAAQGTAAWSATLTVQSLGTALGCDNSVSGSACSSTSVLTEDAFTYDGVSYEVIRLYEDNGTLTFRVNKAIPDALKSALTLNVGANEYALLDATYPTSGNGAEATWSNAALSWSAGDSVQLSLSEPPPAPPAPPVIPSTTVTLVSNTGQGLSNSGNISVENWINAQGFTTGPAKHGYALTSIELPVRLLDALSATDVRNFVVGLWSDSNGVPGTKLADLAPVNFPTGTTGIHTVSFEPKATTTLAANTTYHFVIYMDAGLAFPFLYVTYDMSEDAGASDGWSIEDAASSFLGTGIPLSTPTGPSDWTSSPYSAIQIGVKGFPAPASRSSTPTDTDMGVAIWSATLAVRDLASDGTLLGCSNGTSYAVGDRCNSPSTLMEDSFTLGGNDFTIDALFSEHVSEIVPRSLTLSFDGDSVPASLRHGATLVFDGRALPLSGGEVQTSGATIKWADTGIGVSDYEADQVIEVSLRVSRPGPDVSDWNPTVFVQELGGDRYGCRSGVTVSAMPGRSGGAECSVPANFGGNEFSVSHVRFGSRGYRVLDLYIEPHRSTSWGETAYRVVLRVDDYSGTAELGREMTLVLTTPGVTEKRLPFNTAERDGNTFRWSLFFDDGDLGWAQGWVRGVQVRIHQFTAGLDYVRVHYDEMRDGQPVDGFEAWRPAGVSANYDGLVAYIPGEFPSSDPEQGMVTTTHVKLWARASHLGSTLEWAEGNHRGATGSFTALGAGELTPAIALDPASKWTYVYVRVTNGSQVATHAIAIDPPPRTYTLSPEVSVTEGEAATLTLSLGSPAGAGGVSFTVSADYPDGGATAEDVGQIATTVTVPDGQRSARVTIPTVDDEAIEEDEERFTVRVAHVGEPAWAVDPQGTDTAVVTIVDNDEPPPPQPPEGPEPWDIRVVPGDGTLTVTWTIGSRDGVDDSEIWHVLRWSQEPGVWANPRDPRAVGKNDGLSVDPGLTSYTITDLENGVATGVFIRSMVGHRNNMSEREERSSQWVRVKGEHTTPVAGPNAAPTVSSAIADATIVNESGMHDVSLSGVFSDADGDALAITAASSDTAVATVSVAADYSTLTVSAQARGMATVTVNASDGNGGEASDTFTVRVKAAPTVASAIADVSGLEAEDIRTVSMSGVFSDADGDSLTITASSSDEGQATVSVSVDQSALTVAGVAAGTATITVAAQDTDGNQVSDSFTVTVSAPPNNVPAVATAIADATITNESGTHEASLSGVFSDVDEDDLTITAASSDTAVATVSVAADYSTLTVSAKAQGTATVTVTASDGKGGTVDNTFTVKVKAAPTVAAPIADVSGLEAEDSRAISMSGVFSDADGDAVTVTQASSSDTSIAAVSAAIDGSTAAITAVTVTANSEGTATITVTAQDTDGNTVQDAFDVTVPALATEQQQQAVELPGPVVNLQLEATDGGVIVSWQAPESGDAPRGYIVHLKPEDGGKGRTKTPRAKKTRVSFDNLEAGQTYKVWVRAQNAAGKGERVHASITLP